MKRNDESGKPEKDGATVSSAKGMTENPAASSSGRWSVASLLVNEARAREILSERFANYGARIESDYSFHEGSVLCTLDGYDPEIRIGYSFISHSDEDVITDIDDNAERALAEMAEQGRCYVLVLHDSSVSSADRLMELADQFLAGLPPCDQLRPSD
ncbi:MAG: hypothetical protein KJO07_13835 [Deltaproteobacteria bacterium]|nr:hypothetical protein [Deltaproteobacteria bacterium]